MSVEADQLRQVAELAGRYGVLWHHCGNTRLCAGDPGLPDLILVGQFGVLFAELKSSPIGMTAQQTTWHWMLRASRTAVGVWLPSHFRDGVVEAQIHLIANGPEG